MVGKHVSRFFMYLVLTIVAILSVFPLVWMAISATNTNFDIIAGSLTPGRNLAENFRNLQAAANIGTAFYNSVRNTVVLTALSILICSFAGYGFEIYHSKAKDRLMAFLLLAMMVPFAAILIPLFRLTANFGLLNSLMGFMLPTLATPFLIMFFRQSTRQFPLEIIEAARMDGVSEIGIFFRMYIPTMKSTYAAAITITFLAAWNSFLWPRVIFLTQEAVTLPLVISNLIAGYVTDNGVVMLAVLITTMPTIVIFFFLQRYFAEGILGSVK